MDRIGEARRRAAFSGRRQFRDRQEPDPGDIDAVILLPTDFSSQIERDLDAALDLEQMLLTRRPEELFAAEDDLDWNEWFEFFSRTREADGRRKGLVEIKL